MITLWWSVRTGMWLKVARLCAYPWHLRAIPESIHYGAFDSVCELSPPVFVCAGAD